MASSGWCTIESDPAVFTEMLEQFGVRGVAVEELFTADPDSLVALGKVYGVILLFKYKQVAAAGEVLPADGGAGIYFAKQVINNACATQAIVNTVLNFPKEITLGESLTQFLDFTRELDGTTRGEMLGQFADIRSVHNSFAPPAAFEFEERRPTKDDDAYHFSAFIYKQGSVIELDGLRPGPIRVCAATDDNFRDQICTAIQNKMSQISAVDTSGAGQGISFALMAVTEDRVPVLETQIACLLSSDEDASAAQAELETLQAARAKGRAENVRRRHNYVPVVMALLKALNDKGKLAAIVEDAKAAAEAKSAGQRVRK